MVNKFAVNRGPVDVTRYRDILTGILARTGWHELPGRGYWTAEASESLPKYSRAFFIRIPPHGHVHRHKDKIYVRTDHVVIETNPQALNWWADETGEHSFHMEAGRRYTVERLGEHWATNDGETERIHLLLEY